MNGAKDGKKEVVWLSFQIFQWENWPHENIKISNRMYLQPPLQVWNFMKQKKACCLPVWMKKRKEICERNGFCLKLWVKCPHGDFSKTLSVLGTFYLLCVCTRIHVQYKSTSTLTTCTRILSYLIKNWNILLSGAPFYWAKKWGMHGPHNAVDMWSIVSGLPLLHIFIESSCPNNWQQFYSFLFLCQVEMVGCSVSCL